MKNTGRTQEIHMKDIIWEGHGKDMRRTLFSTDSD